LVHLLSLQCATGGRRPAGRDAINQNQMLCTMGLQRLAGAMRPVQNIIPLVRVMEGTEDNAADQFQIIFRQCIP